MRRGSSGRERSLHRRGDLHRVERLGDVTRGAGVHCLLHQGVTVHGADHQHRRGRPAVTDQASASIPLISASGDHRMTRGAGPGGAAPWPFSASQGMSLLGDISRAACAKASSSTMRMGPSTCPHRAAARVRRQPRSPTPSHRTGINVRTGSAAGRRGVRMNTIRRTSSSCGRTPPGSARWR